MNSFTFIKPPEYVGYYVLNPGSEPYVTWHWSVRPSWWHRLCARVFFGWRWHEKS